MNGFKIIYAGKGVPTDLKIGICTQCSDSFTYESSLNPELYESHSCPYQQDIHDDELFKCNCCDSCTQNCIESI